jgi:hypothetical protein
MNKYLLLRDNKQSGPYSVPELIEKGIKAYDLVWLDGKSVAWRYPSEIEELKAYAPVVEEQPFDRFYKRPDSVVNATPAIAATVEEITSRPSPYEPKVTVETTVEELPPQKKVYINFPVAPPAHKNIITEHKPQATEKKTVVPEPAPGPVSFAEKNNYYQPAERITTYNPKTATNKNYVYFAAAACIILLGFIVVLFINNSSQKEQLKELNTIVKDIENKKANEAALTTQVKNTSPEPSQSQTSETIVNPELLSDNDYNQQKTESKGSATPPAEVTPAPNISEKTVEIAPGITYKERPVLRRSDKQQQEAAPAGDNVVSEDAATSSENLYKLVSVKPNNYKTGVLGGISNLQFELTNNSNRELHKVAIEIKYLGPEKKVVNKQTVYFENVSPGEHSTIDVPKSKRGVSIDYTITDIKS